MTASPIREKFGVEAEARAIALMMSAIRPAHPGEAAAKRNKVADLMRVGYEAHMHGLYPELPSSTFDGHGEIIWDQLRDRQPWYLTTHFAELYRSMIEGYDPNLNPPEPELSRPPMFFTAPGAELFFPGKDGGNAVMVTVVVGQNEQGDTTGDGLIMFADGGMSTFPMHKGELARRLIGLLWLVQQRELATVELQDHTRKPSRAEKRAGKKATVNKVHVVDLRHAVRVGVQNAAAANAAGATRRQYKNRWIVQGHWRNQRVGVGRTEIQRTFVAPYVKGPNGAPLVDHVYKW